MFNSKKIRSIIFILIILFFVIILSVKSFAVVSPTKDFFINDYANILSEETKKYIMKTNVELQRKTGAQIVVVTVTSLEGQSLEEYATELFRKFGIGDSEKNNGILLLVSIGERELRIEVGYGLEGAITDGKAGQIRDNIIVPYLKQNDWNNGIKNGFNALLDEVINEYNISITSKESVREIQSSSTLTDEQSSDISFGIGIIMTAGLSFIIGCILRGKSTKFKIILLVLYSIFLIWFIHYLSYDARGIVEISIPERCIIFLVNCLVLSIYYYLPPKKKKTRNSSSWYSDNDFWNNDSFGGGSSGGGYSGGGGSSGGGGASGKF